MRYLQETINELVQEIAIRQEALSVLQGMAGKTVEQKETKQTKPKRTYKKRAVRLPAARKTWKNRIPREPAGAEYIDAVRRAKEPFRAGDLNAVLNVTPKKAQNLITQWSGKGWLNRTGPGEYTRSKQFGQTGHTMLADIHREIDAKKGNGDE
jgi:hypothetical protein